ncbi:M15 family metallopeptidase [Leifsonia kafniensis]|uniref:M15 family metallopeptidase n=1 Tax=Leifsonia kafniensis TaxID=475957 RepID=UPI0031E875BB
MSDDRPRTRDSQQVRRRRVLLIVAVGAVLSVAAVGAGAVSGRASSPSAGGWLASVIGTPTSTPTSPPISPPTSTPNLTSTPTPLPTFTPRPVPAQTVAPVPVPTFNRVKFSIDDPASIWVVVNKMRPLNPLDFVPSDLVEVPVAHTWVPLLRQEASTAVVALLAAASAEAGLSLASNSAYRSYTTQVEVYNDDVAANGQAFADTSTARPGTSEHQTGLTIDIGPESRVCSLNTCFADTPEGQWLAANAWRFGFLLRYPADKVEVTGYAFEPWHFRYVGVELSTEMHEKGVSTLEEFFGLPAAPNYG